MRFTNRGREVERLCRGVSYTGYGRTRSARSHRQAEDRLKARTGYPLHNLGKEEKGAVCGWVLGDEWGGGNWLFVWGDVCEEWIMVDGEDWLEVVAFEYGIVLCMWGVRCVGMNFIAGLFYMYPMRGCGRSYDRLWAEGRRGYRIRVPTCGYTFHRGRIYWLVAGG